jgi:hypothetical protein
MAEVGKALLESSPRDPGAVEQRDGSWPKIGGGKDFFQGTRTVECLRTDGHSGVAALL